MMKQLFKLAALAMMAAVLPTTLASCGDDDNDDGDKDKTAVASVQLDKTSVNLSVGGVTATVAYALLPADATNRDITVTSSNEKVCTAKKNDPATDGIGVAAPIGYDGVVLIAPKAEGTATVTIASKSNPRATATLQVTVDDEAVPISNMEVQRIRLETDYVEVPVYEQRGVEYKVLPEDAPNKEVTVTSSNKDIDVSVDDHSDAGWPITGYIFVRPYAAGTATVTVTSKSNPDVKATFVVKATE